MPSNLLNLMSRHLNLQQPPFLPLGMVPRFPPVDTSRLRRRLDLLSRVVGRHGVEGGEGELGGAEVDGGGEEGKGGEEVKGGGAVE